MPPAAKRKDNKKVKQPAVKQEENGSDNGSVSVTGSAISAKVAADKSGENMAAGGAASSSVISTETPLKQCTNVVEKKLRNLEKRKVRLKIYDRILNIVLFGIFGVC